MSSSTTAFGGAIVSPLPPPIASATSLSGPVCCAYLDLSNIWLPGAQISAVRRGSAPSAQAAAALGIIDPMLRLNLRALHRFAIGSAAGRCRTVCVGSTKDADDVRIAKAARDAGWDTRMLVRAKDGREKAVDTTLSVVMLEDLLTSAVKPSDADITVLSGDRDLLPAVNALRRRGFAVDIVAWRHATSSELIQAARKFIALDQFFDHLTFRQRTD